MAGKTSLAFFVRSSIISALHTLLSEVKPGCIQYHIPVVACASIACAVLGGISGATDTGVEGCVEVLIRGTASNRSAYARGELLHID